MERLLNRVETLEFDAGVGGAEAPVDRRLGTIACGLPSGDLMPQQIRTAEASIQTLLPQHGQFDLGHVEPTAVFGRVMKLQFPRDPPRLGGRERLVEGRRAM